MCKQLIVLISALFVCREYLNDSDIEGGEEGVAKVEDDVKVTPFNMKEELEEGHFDKDGHYHWNKETEAKDNWLDNIDWVKVRIPSLLPVHNHLIYKQYLPNRLAHRRTPSTRQKMKKTPPMRRRTNPWARPLTCP